MVNYKSASGQLENSWWLQDNTINGAMSITTNFVINQVIWYFLTNCFTFLTKGWMPQVRKSCSCGISAIFFQCFFYDWNTSINDSFRFFRVFSRNHLLERGFTFQWGSCLSDGVGFIFKWRDSWGGGIGFVPRNPERNLFSVEL